MISSVSPSLAKARRTSLGLDQIASSMGRRTSEWTLQNGRSSCNSTSNDVGKQEVGLLGRLQDGLRASLYRPKAPDLLWLGLAGPSVRARPACMEHPG